MFRTSILKKYTAIMMFLFIGAVVSAQDIEITGRVIDLSTKQGFAGARVSVVNTKITTMSGEDGTFTVKVPTKDVALAIDAPGFQNQTLALKGRTQVEIYMLQQSGAVSISENNSFTTKSAVSITGFSDNISGIDEDFTNRLSGQIRAVTHSGTPGNGTAVFARGFKSLNASSQPLYVVDGIVWQNHDDISSIHEGFYNNPLAVIDPNDVEKVTVLKGSSSIYGSKGANGVILIDTKRSRSQATAITVNMGLGYRSPFQTIPVMDANAYRLYASDIIGGKYSNTTAVEKYKFLDDDITKSYYKANHNNTDWLSLINQIGLSQNYGICVQGGDAVALYAISVGYVKSEGNIQNTGFDRLNFRANSDINMTKNFKVNFDIAFTQASNNVRNDGINAVSSPVYISLIKSPLYNPYQFDKNGNLSSRLSDYDELSVGNPLAITESGIGRSKQYALNTSVRPTYVFGDDKVKVSALFSYGWRKLNENSFLPDNGVAEAPLTNELGEIYAIARNLVQDRMDTYSSIIVNGQIDWNILKDASQSLTAFGGYRFYSDIYKSHYAMGYNTGSDNMTQLTNTTENLRFSDGIDDNWRSMSWYLNSDYSFKNKYLINISAAMDASSKFGKEATGAIRLGGISWGLFPSISGGWVLSSEDFMKEVTFVNFLKITAGHNISGNDNIPNYASRTYFSSLNYTGLANGLILANIGNPALKWETTSMSSFGVNVSMFNNIWNIDAEVYASNTKDLLTQKQLTDLSGLKYYWSNDGTMKNTGFEISSNVRVINKDDLKFDVGVSVGKYKNEITSLANGEFVTDIAGAQILTKVGQPAGVFYGYKTAGVFSTMEEAANANLSIKNISGQLISFGAGDMHFEEVDVDNVIDEKDRQIIGDPNPDFYGNFNFNLTWKQFTFAALFTYSYGNDVYNALRANLEAGRDESNQSVAMQNRWVAEGQITEIPRATFDDPMGNSRFSDRWIEDGSYLRFKSFSLSYKIPIKLTFIQGVSVSASVNNIFTQTKYLGADPEFAYGNSVLYQGIDAGLTPQTRMFNFGVKVNL